MKLPWLNFDKYMEWIANLFARNVAQKKREAI